MGYREVYQSSKENSEQFWLDAAKAIDWDQFPTKALNDANAPLYEWFTDGMVNTCYNAVDRHVENGRADQTAIIYDSPITGVKDKITYAELKDKVASLAGAMVAKASPRAIALLSICQWSPKHWSRCWPVHGLALFIRLCLVDLRQMNWRFALMMPSPK